MDMKREAMDELREYEAKKSAVESLSEEIAHLRAEGVRLGGGSGTAPVKGGGTAWEDKQINRIIRLEKLETSLGIVRAWLRRVDRGLDKLSSEERLILDRFFINPAKGNVDRLCEELNLEQSTVYRHRDRALRHYTLVRFGVVEV